MGIQTAWSYCMLVNRLYQSVAVTKRLPKPNEVLVSMDGSPVSAVMSGDETNSTFVLPVNDNSQVSLVTAWLYQCSMCSNPLLH